MLRFAFSPSRLWNDPVWGEPGAGPAGVRQTRFSGERSEGHYHFHVDRQAAEPTDLARWRAVLELRHSGQNEFVWARRDELQVGRFSGADAENVFRSGLRALETSARQSEPVKAALERDLPRTRLALGRALTLEALRTRLEASGAVSVFLSVRLDPASLARTHPRYARFLAHYVTPMKASMRAIDDEGHPLFEAEGAQLRGTARFRIRDGRLLALGGPASPWPTAFDLRMSFSTRNSLFRVGLEDLVGRVSVTGSPALRLGLSFRKEPDWILPFFVKPFLRGPLKHPFEGDGSSASLAAEARPAGHLLLRAYTFPVQESFVTRWVGSLMSTTVADFRAGPEPEADAFTRECLLALRDDFVTLK